MSFFEKLKKGMETESAPEENQRQKPKQNPVAEKIPVSGIPAKAAPEKEEPKRQNQGFYLENLNKQEGELAIDVYQTEEELVVRSAIAGVKLENLDVTIENDVITIRGNREEPQESGKADYFFKECYFGPFARKIISPVEIDTTRARATIKEGVLLVRIPKIKREKKVKLEIEKAQ